VNSPRFSGRTVVITDEPGYPICEVTVTEVGEHWGENPLAPDSEKDCVLLDKIKEWADKAKQSENTEEAKEAIREGARSLLSLLIESLGSDTNFIAYTTATNRFEIGPPFDPTAFIDTNPKWTDARLFFRAQCLTSLRAFCSSRLVRRS
jgi:hypothetical protein